MAAANAIRTGRGRSCSASCTCASTGPPAQPRGEQPHRDGDRVDIHHVRSAVGAAGRSTAGSARRVPARRTGPGPSGDSSALRSTGTATTATSTPGSRSSASERPGLRNCDDDPPAGGPQPVNGLQHHPVRAVEIRRGVGDQDGPGGHHAVAAAAPAAGPAAQRPAGGQPLAQLLVPLRPRRPSRSGRPRCRLRRPRAGDARPGRPRPPPAARPARPRRRKNRPAAEHLAVERRRRTRSVAVPAPIARSSDGLVPPTEWPCR